MAPGIRDGAFAMNTAASVPPRKGVVALVLLLGLGAGGCGRRGPPLPPVTVEPEAPRLLPLRQEGGDISIRWYAPRLTSSGDVEDLRLRKAIVSYRVVDLHRLSAEERAAQRAGPEEGEPEDVEPEDMETEEVEPEDMEPEDVEPLDVEPEDVEPEDVEPEEVEPEVVEPEESGEAPSEDEVPVEADAPEQPEGEAVAAALPSPEDPGPGETGEAIPPAAEPAPPSETPAEESAAAQPDPTPVPPGPEVPIAEEQSAAAAAADEAGPETEAQQEGEAPDAGDPQDEAAEEPSDDAEPPAEPEPAGFLLDYEELEFEILSEVESEAPGEERVLELPVDPEWIGRRLEIRMHYESRGGTGEETETQSLDVIGALPVVEDVAVEISPQALTVSWFDSRPQLTAVSVLADPVFEVLRRRGGESEPLGRSVGPTLEDPEVVWGEEVCYRVRVVVAGANDERVLSDPGPVADPEADSSDEAAAAAGEVGDAVQETTPREPGAPETPPAAPLPDAPESEEPEWQPIPIRVPGAGSAALSFGPTSIEACVTPMDVFPPAPPSDLRLFWRSERTELSWRESVSGDVVGYHVYRSGPDGTGFKRLTLDPVEQIAFGDAARDPRGRYRYAVTAVDGADPPNESLPSESRTVSPR